ncbi:hypothetical protein [Streptomyces sp. NPDC002547]
MTERHTASSINDADLDALYNEIDRLSEEHAAAVASLADMARNRNEWQWRAEEGQRTTQIQRLRAEHAEMTAANLRARLKGAHTRLLALATDLEHPKHRGEYGIPHPVVAVMIRDALGGEAPAATEATDTRSGLQRWADALLHRGPGYDLSPPFIDRPFRSHRTETAPAHACTYGERCPNCRD